MRALPYGWAPLPLRLPDARVVRPARVLHVGVYAAPLSLLDLTAAWGTSPLRQAYLHPVVPSQQRATVVLFDSMISITVAVETGAYARSS